MASPIKEEIHLVAIFRERLRDVLVTSEQRSGPFLLRWIRARDYDLLQAETMLRQSFEWRDKLALKPLTVPYWFRLNFPYWMDSVDTLGNPVVELPVGSWDFSSLMRAEYSCNLEDFFTYYYEQITDTIRSVNKGCETVCAWQVTQCTIIVDWKGYSYTQLLDPQAVSCLLKLAHIYEANYPEMIFKIYYVNCPPTFPLLLAMLKKVIAPKTMDKISFYNGEDEWKPVLFEEIGENNLGHMYGGKKIRMVGYTVFSYDNTWRMKEEVKKGDDDDEGEDSPAKKSRIF